MVSGQKRSPFKLVTNMKYKYFQFEIKDMFAKDENTNKYKNIRIDAAFILICLLSKTSCFLLENGRKDIRVWMSQWTWFLARSILEGI